MTTGRPAGSPTATATATTTGINAFGNPEKSGDRA